MKAILCTLSVGLLAFSLQASEVGLRIRFGLTDDSNTKWDGTVAVSPGQVANISGWRFQQTDTVDGTTGWKASTRPLTVRRANAAKKGPAAAEQKKEETPAPKKGAGKKKGGKAAEPAGGAGGVAMADNGVVLRLTGVTESSVVTIKTAKGDFEFKLSDVPYGKVVEKLDGAVDIERTAATQPLTSQRADDDFPTLAVGADGTVYEAHVSFTPGLDRDERAKSWSKDPGDLAFLAKPPGGDQIWLRVIKDGKAGEAIAVTPGKGDVFKTSLAVDGKGVLWIVWSENKAWQDKKALADFEVWARSFKDGKLSDPVNLSKNTGSDVSPVAATDSKGKVWVAWQAARENVFRIVAKHQTDKGWSDEVRVSSQKFSCWLPAIAASKDGKVAIAWDTYDKGDYDVWVREFSTDGKGETARPVANSEMYEARAAITYDHDNRLWISYEMSGATWGKDWGALVKDKGIGLYKDRQIGMKVLENGQWMDPAGSYANALPGAKKRRGPGALPVRTPEPDAATRKAGEEAEAAPAGAYNNLARIVCDSEGRIWLFARSREGNFHTPLGSVWIDYATYFDGQKWVGPILLPHSDNLLYNLPAVAAHPDGGLVVAHSSDHRQSRHIQGPMAGSNASLESGKDPFDNDVFLSRLESPGGKVAITVKPAKTTASASAAPSAATEKERAEIERCHQQQIDYNGTKLQLIRGEFHRHTEISGDGGNDGPLEDMWRYAMDVAAMDWIGCADHDNGGGREYTWWLTQKTTDAFRLPNRFDPPFAYERSVKYPEGHRNVIFAERGIRTLPRLPISDRDEFKAAPDTDMLYKYLHLFNGVCASHTSTTSMGTDWRNNDPKVEPMVEIYQGCRQNYERPGAPRCPTPNDAIGGWEPKGWINIALKMGYRFSFESSSDHTSTHISYAIVYAEDRTREGLLKAMRLRHTYAATDNIIAEYTCKTGGHTYMMGDEFTTSEAPKVHVKFGGTGAFKKVVLVKDDVETVLGEPNKADVEFTWTDPKPEAGKTSYYYVRGEQADGELVWASPMWIKYEPKK